MLYLPLILNIKNKTIILSLLFSIDVFYFGKMGLKYDEVNKSFAFTDVDKRNALGLEENDLFISVDSIAATDTNIDDLWENYFQKNTTKPELAVTIKRKGELKTLEGPLYKGYLESKNYIASGNNPLPAEIQMRNS